MGWLNTPKAGPGSCWAAPRLPSFLFLECGGGGMILGAMVAAVIAVILLE